MEDIEIKELCTYSTKLDLYNVNFFGTKITVTVTSNASVARSWVCFTRFLHRRHFHRLVVGIGVQWVPGPESNPAATLQVCVGRRCLIYQLEEAERVPMALRRFLMFPTVTLVGIWNHSDAVKLMISRHRLQVKHLIDLRHYARTDDGQSMARASTEQIVEEELGYEGVALDQWVSRSDWEREILNTDQVRQACVKAYVAFEIGRNLRAWEI